MIEITPMLLDSKRTRPALRNKKFYSLRKLKGVVAHWTANSNRGANARANRNYFNNTDRYASAHYVIDDHSIIQCIPNTEIAYHVGGRFYRPAGEAVMEDGLTPNYFLIGFEMCVNQDGDWDKTYENSVALAQHLLNAFNFGVDKMYRHYDITGKDCPKMMLDESDWDAFKADIAKGVRNIHENPIEQAVVEGAAFLNVRSGIGTQHKIVRILKKDERTAVYEKERGWYRVGKDEWASGHYLNTVYQKKAGIIEVDDPTGLNVRTGPGVSHPIVDVVSDGTQVQLLDQEGNWYEIAPSRWVYGAYVRITEVKKGIVAVPQFLNVRKGPGTTNELVGQVENGTEVTLFEEYNGWYRIGEDRWVYGAFIKIQ
jgi:N-acetylmuramoyl-L-alanine amidase